MEQMHETRMVGTETIQQNNLIRRQLGIRAYQIANTKYSTALSEQFAAYDLAIIHEAMDAIPHLVDGQQELPIEISK